MSNWLLAEISAQLRLGQPLALPTHLQVEPTNRCNLRCLVCPTVTGEMKRARGDMLATHFERLMDEVGESLLLLLLWEWGEPFLNAGLCDLIAAAKRHGVKVVTSTNGHFVQSRARAREVIESGLDTLVFALDGVTGESYQKYRRGGKFNRVLSSIRILTETKWTLRAISPLVVLQFIVLRHNEVEIEPAIDLARTLGVDVLTFRTANPYHREFEATYLPEDPRYRQFEYVPGTNDRKRKPNTCKRFWNMPAVQWDGRVSHCEFDVNGEFELGNAFHSSLAEIWRGHRYRMARQAFATHRPITRPCRECIYNFSSVHDIVAQAVPISAAARCAGVGK
ncbi:MAG: SPASM domain-containing protein [Chloroflexi bacterium]|nr:SPASM domain-containing protein [Chloroflexota bacterium]